MELNQSEIKVLSSIFQNPVEIERIKSGNLYDYQLTALNKLRNLIAYLELKYQTTSFEVVRYEMASSDTNTDFFSFSYQNSEEHYHAIIDQNGLYLDDFYGALFQNQYDQKIIDILEIDAIVGIKTFFKTLYHESILFNQSIIHQRKPIRDTEIFINDQNIQIEKIKDALKQYDIKGNYRIYISGLFEPSLNIDDYWKLWKENMEIIQAESFRVL